ncbi:amino acid racemase [Candidatus Peribacteria bacterium]|nr:amino acid racemase [Candidatus Peribacteria bacterium]
MNQSRLTLGILGGMGPHAGLRFCELLLQLSIDRYGSKRNADFPHFLLSNLPVPDLISSREDEERTVTMVEAEAKRLEVAGAELIVLACNTMHLFEERFRSAIAVPFLSIIDAVMKNVQRDGRKTVGLLGSMTTMQSTLYSAPLQRAGIELILPSPAEQEELTRCVQTIVAHQVGDEERALLRRQMESLHEKGAEAVILGCTELPQILTPDTSGIPVYDSLRILAEAACAAMYFPSSISSCD